jgi:DNA-damage-inducible protein D
MTKKSTDSAKLAGMAFGEALERLTNTEPREVAMIANASMKDGAIERLIAAFEDAAQRDDEGNEFWTARTLARLLEYADYRNFLNIIDKAKLACQNSGQPITDHFGDVTDMIEIGKGGSREVDDVHLSRYAAYLVAQNADPRKSPVAFAQTYFAIQTRRQEILDDETSQYVPLSEDQKRVLLREEIKTHNKHLFSAAKGAGVIEPIDYAIFQTYGYKGLYGGLDRPGIQRRKGLRAKQPILDHMGSTELAANLFRATQTEDKLRRDNVKGKDSANSTHYDVGRTVRKAIAEIGGTMPENLPPAEDVSKVARRLRKGITSTPKKLK